MQAERLEVITEEQAFELQDAWMLNRTSAAALLEEYEPKVKITEGAIVELVGLRARHEFNHATAIVLKHARADASARVPVRVLLFRNNKAPCNTQCIKLKVENVRISTRIELARLANKVPAPQPMTADEIALACSECEIEPQAESLGTAQQQLESLVNKLKEFDFEQDVGNTNSDDEREQPDDGVLL